MVTALRMEETKHLLVDIQDAIEFRDPFLAEGRRNIEYREGRRFTAELMFGTGEMPARDEVPDNIYQATVKGVIPALVMFAPRMVVRPAHSKHELAAAQLEAKANFDLKRNHWQEQAEYGVINTLDYGWGIWQIGFSIPMGGFPTQAPDTRKGAPLARQISEGFAGGDALFGGEDTQQGVNRATERFERSLKKVTKKNPLLWTEQRIRPGTVWIMSVLPEDFVIDPAATDLRDAAWVAKAIYMTQAELFEYGKIGRFHGDLKAIQPYSFRENVGTQTTAIEELRGIGWLQRKARSQRRLQIVKLWEVWDRRTMRYLVVGDGHNLESIAEAEWPAPRESFPFKMCNFNPRQGRLYPRSDLSVLEPAQNMVNILNSLAIEMARKRKRITAFDRMSGIQESDIDALARSEPGEFVGLPGNPNEILKQLELGDDPNLWIQVKEMIKATSRNEFGQPAEEQGGPSAVDTATQAAILAKNSQLKHFYRKQKIHNCFTDIYDDYLDWMRYSWLAEPQSAALWMKRLLEPRTIFKGERGLGVDGSQINILLGLDLAEIEADYQVLVDSSADTPFDKSQLIGEVMELMKIGIPTGAIDPHRAVELILDLKAVRWTGLLRERQEVREATEEHLLMLQGQKVNIQPYENHPQHFRVHQEQAQKIQQAMLSGQPQDPITQMFFERQEAIQLLQEHLQEYQQKMGLGGGGGGAGGRGRNGPFSANEANQSPQRRQTQQQQRPGSNIPAGVVGQNLGAQLQGTLG